MTLAQAWSLQTAVYGRLTTALASAALDGGAIPVTDHPPRNPPPLHCRIDDGQVADVASKAPALGRHTVIVHAFDRGAADGARRGRKEVKRVIALVDAALNAWAPLEGGATLRFEASSVGLDEDGLTQHAWARYSIILGG